MNIVVTVFKRGSLLKLEDGQMKSSRQPLVCHTASVSKAETEKKGGACSFVRRKRLSLEGRL